MKIRRKSLIVKRSIRIAGRRTGVGVEDAFWNGLKEIARGRDITLSDLVAAINFERKHRNLSSAVRLFVLDHYRRQVAAKFRPPAKQRKRVVQKERH
jgi:predicted DNA-binding ribbon-helix-helix protein